MKTELYIHIPFCVKKCNYCDFLSFSSNENDRSRYVDAVLRQIEEESSNLCLSGNVPEISSIYMGGGTPSVLGAEEISRIMSKVFTCFNVDSDSENTIEVNPGTIELCKLKELKNAGFNRISIGMQSTKNETLRMLGRIHTYDEFYQNYVNSREAGFDNINIDVMMGLPEQSLDEVMSTVSDVISLNPEHISAYSLIIEEGTPFYKQYGNIEGPVVGEELERKMYWETVDLLASAGYSHYEISNFAKPTFESRHNSGYWKRTPYIGIGLGASSLMRQVEMDTGEKSECRIRNLTNFEDYIRNPLGKDSVTELSIEEQMDEFMFLGLRMSRGVDLDEFRKIYKTDAFVRYEKSLMKLVKEELIKIDNSFVKLTRKGVDYGNYVFSQFFLE